MTDTPPVTEDQVRARHYPHPAMSRPVVRLVPDAVAPATDVEMEMLGFGAPVVHEPSLTAPRRPLGYPGWALLNDPDNAAAALTAAKAMRTAAASASMKPSIAVELYDKIGAQVPVTHLPALYEQAARDFLDRGREYWAGIFFTKAREVEIVHALDIDPHYRHLSYVEFAVAGAVTVKALKAYAGELSHGEDPKKAYDTFLDLAMRRTKAGVPPWTGLVAQMKDLAKKAGMDVNAALEDIAVSLLRLPATRRSAAGFWTALTPVLLRLVGRDEETRRRVVELFPEERDWWWAFLGRFDAAGSITDVRDWLKRAHRHATGSYGNGSVPADLVALVPSLAPRVDEPVEVRTWANHYGVVDADLVEACVAAGMPVAVPEERVHFALNQWATHTGLNTLGSLEEWGPLLRTSVTAYLRRESARKLMDHPVLRPFVDEVLRSWIARASDELAGLVDIQDVLDDLARALTDCPIPAALAEAIAAIDVNGALLRCLRGGILDEYHWPALEEAVGELKTVTGHSASWPILTVWDESKAIAVGPDGIVARYRFPANQETYNLGVVYSDGQFLVRNSWGKDHWSGSPQDDFDSSYVHFSFLSSDLGYSMLNPDGRRFGTREPLTAGSTIGAHDGYAPHVLSDGVNFWNTGRNNAEGNPTRVDPSTGADLDDQSLPALLSVPELSGEESVRKGHSSLARLPESVTDSPLGSVDGLVGAVVWGAPARSQPYQPGDDELASHIRHLDGRRASLRTRARDQWWPHNLMDFPGGAGWKVLTHQSHRHVGLSSPESGATHWRVDVGSGDGDKTSYCETAAGSPFVPPPAYWHFFVPRTAEGSAELRAIDAESVTTLLGTEQKYKVAVIETLLPAAGRQLGLGVHGMVNYAAAQAARRDKLTEVKAEAVPTIDAAVLVNATKGIVHSDWGARYQSALAQIQSFGDLLAGRIDQLKSDAPGFELRLYWHHLIGDIEALAWRAASPAVDAETREALLALLDVWAQTPFADPDLAVRVSTVDRNAYDLENSGGSLVGQDTRYLRHENTIISVGAAPTAIFETRETGPGWGTAETLLEFSRLLAENGPVAWDPEAAQALADGTGLTLATASWLLITVPLYDSWPRDVERDKLIRDTVGLKAKALTPGRTEAERLGDEGVRALYRGLLPQDPAELWAPGGMRALAVRLAERYTELHGRRTAVPESTVEAMAAYNPSAAIGMLLERMTAPHALESLTTDIPDRIVWQDGGTSAVERIGEHLSDLLSGLVRAMFTAYYALPAGDVVRATVPELARLIRARLTAPGLIFTASRRWSNSAEVASLRASLGGKPYIRADGKPADDVVDTGALIVEFHGSYYDVFVRPALIGDTPEGRLARTLTTGWNDPLPIVDLARGDGLAGIVERIESGGLPDGAYEADPAKSAPKLLAEVAAELGLDPDAAALYLQLLALTEPTDRNVRRWNAWTPARHKKAQAALVDAGLVVEATRARAGRKVFIAGQWSALKAPMLPVETAKLDLYGDTPFGNLLPLRPIPELFAEAWRRRRAGEG